MVSVEHDQRRQDLANESLSSHDVSGGFTTLVNLTEVKRGEYYVGSYVYLQTTCTLKFAKFDRSDENITRCDTVIYLSEKAKTAYCLAPEISGTLSDGSIVLGYRFASPFSYRQTGSFGKENGIIDLQVGTDTRNLLYTINQMHKNNVMHGGLRHQSSYVFRGSLLHIVSPTIDGELLSLEEREAAKREDLLAFRDFLLGFPRGSPSLDWDFFIALFSENEINILGLINHPALKGVDEKLEYFQGWYDCCFQKRHNAVDYTEIKKNLRTSWKIYDWPSSLKPGFYEDRFRKKFYNKHSIYDLLRYIRNLLKYYREHDYTTTASKIENDLSFMFPGLISAMHNACVVTNSHDFRFAME